MSAFNNHVVLFYITVADQKNILLIIYTMLPCSAFHIRKENHLISNHSHEKLKNLH